MNVEASSYEISSSPGQEAVKSTTREMRGETITRPGKDAEGYGAGDVPVSDFVSYDMVVNMHRASVAPCRTLPTSSL